MTNEELTVKEFAAKERVDERTVRRWITKGAVDVRRTPGGRVRVLDQAGQSRANTDNRGHAAQ